jgi:hypothetical protein
LMEVFQAGNSYEVTNCCPITQLSMAYITSTVSDGRGGVAIDSVQIWVTP